jgi:pimeloyl-ACP methyl ester carboxylesterase
LRLATGNNVKKCQDIWFESGDGLRLYACDYPNAESALTVICIPGLTRNSADFAELAEHLSSRYRVVAVDLRGRGKSDYDTNSGNYNLAVYIADMVVLIQRLELKSIVLVGSSLGGLISMVLAAALPESIAGLILNDIGPEINPAGLERIQGYITKPATVTNWSEAIERTRSIHGGEYPDFSAEDWDSVARKLYREKNGIPVLDYDPAISEPFASSGTQTSSADLWSVYQSISDIPLMLIYGALSDIITPATITMMRSLRPDLEVLKVGNRGHVPLLTEAVCLRRIDGFLQDCVQSRIE